MYEPGELGAVAYKAGAEWATEAVQTAGAPAALSVSVDREVIGADGSDPAFVTVRVADAAGVLAPRANDLVQFQVEGAGELVARNNGDPTDLTPFRSRERRAFGGLALAHRALAARASRQHSGEGDFRSARSGQRYSGERERSTTW